MSKSQPYCQRNAKALLTLTLSNKGKITLQETDWLGPLSPTQVFEQFLGCDVFPEEVTW